MYLSLALRAPCKVHPLPAPAVSPITPLYPFLPNTLSVLAMLPLSSPAPLWIPFLHPAGPPSPSPPGKCPSAFQVKVAQSGPTLFHPMDWKPPGFSVDGILQARILEWVAMSSSRVSS